MTGLDLHLQISECEGGGLHGGFDGSGERLALVLLVLPNTVPRGSRGGFGGCGGFGRDGYPPYSTPPPFSGILRIVV